MNPELNALFARRSIRQYEEKPVPEERVRDVLEAAMAAPSAVAKDPWHFIILQDPEARDRLADGLPNGPHLRDAPAAVVVCGDLDRGHRGEESFLLQDCSAAIENLLLAASMLGLGTCWLGIHPSPERIQHVRDLCRLPERVLPVSAITLGWPAEDPPPRTRYRDDAVHWGTF